MSIVASPKIQTPRSAGAPPALILSSELENSSKGSSLILLTESQVSPLLQVSLARLRKWRVEKRGPRFIKVGSLVRYRLADLQQWLSALPAGGDGAPLLADQELS